MCGKRLSPDTAAYLLLLLNEKHLKVTEIAKKLKISRSCVHSSKKYGLFRSKEKMLTKEADRES